MIDVLIAFALLAVASLVTFEIVRWSYNTGYEAGYSTAQRDGHVPETFEGTVED